jgi:hypothetical protein
MGLGKIINVAPVKRAGLSSYALLEQLSHQGALAAATRSHDVEVVTLAAHADAELCSIYGTYLSDDLGKVLEFRGSFERELGGIAAPVKTFCHQWFEITHCSFSSVPRYSETKKSIVTAMCIALQVAISRLVYRTVILPQ